MVRFFIFVIVLFLVSCTKDKKTAKELSIEHFKVGISFIKSKKYANAIEVFTKSIDENPTVQAYIARCIANGEIGKNESAVRDCTKAIEMDPKMSNAYYNRAILLDRLGMDDASIGDYTKSISLNKNHILAYINRGVKYASMSYYDKAISDYNSVIRLNKNYVAAYINRSIVYAVIGKYSLALSDINRALAIDSRNKIAIKLKTHLESKQK